MKYKVDCGAFVTKFVDRSVIVHAKDKDEAAQKAKDKFFDLISQQGHNCEDVRVEWVREER